MNKKSEGTKDESREGQQKAYEKAKGLVSRKELKENIAGLTDDLTNDQFYSFYTLLWNLSASQMLLNQKQRRVLS